MGEVLVEVKNVSKKFCKDLKTSLKYGLVDSLSAVFSMSKRRKNITLRHKEFWAVRNVSFQLKRGECIGLIGHNGAGKSTLLKVINGLIMPDEGEVIMRGKVGALIELGAGFNPILTGRENIYNNAAVLGFTRAEVKAKIDAIITFSEIEEFIDSPVQNYSSGMKVRLGFGIAAHLEPDVLIIDEVLAVGDLGFVLKCFKTIDKILPHTAVVFVSHSMPMVSRMCNEIILMDKGQVAYHGENVGRGIDLYYNRFANNGSSVVFTDNSLELISVTINNDISDVPILNWKDDLIVEVKINNLSCDELPDLGIIIFDKEQRGVANLRSTITNGEFRHGKVTFTVEHKCLQLSQGVYSLNVVLVSAKSKSPILRVNGAKSFQLVHDFQNWQPFLLDCEINVSPNDV